MSPADKQSATIHYEDRDGYLYAFVSGEEDTLEISLDYWRRVIAECRNRGFDRVLVEEDFPNQVSVTDMYTVITTIVELVTDYLKIAFVDRRSEQEELNEFGETMAVNRGVHGRVFSNADDAEQWLLS